jgi:nicotinamidase-related amidase
MKEKSMHRELPIPPYHDDNAVAGIWPVPYARRAAEAERWATEHEIPPAAADNFRLCLQLVDLQSTFCVPGFELFVAGGSGTGAVDDNRRLCRFLYRNLGAITQVVATLDTHLAFQVFHPAFLVDPTGHHPEPFTQVSVEDVEAGCWRFNEALAPGLGLEPGYGQEHLLSYVRKLRQGGKYDLTVWPYHSMLGSVGHALVPAVEQAIFFHTIARNAPADFRIKGRNPLTEHYSVLGPEVTTGPGGEPIATRDDTLLGKLLEFDALVIAGQAKSHCVAWTVSDLLTAIGERDPQLARRIYLLEDCTSPVVVPGADYTEAADAAFRRFAEAGMHVVRSTEPLERWPGMVQLWEAGRPPPQPG